MRIIKQKNKYMIQHYFKVAWRNLLRYKTQSIISIVGLAVGFTCFALATLWIRYEMTYDGFHDGADRTYMLYDKGNGILGQSHTFGGPLAGKLKRDFPEIEATCAIKSPWAQDYQTDDQRTHSIFAAGIDSCFLQMFDIRLLAGAMDFLHDAAKIAVTPETSLRLFGKEDPLGKVLLEGGQAKTICAVVQGWGEHSNLPYGILTGIVPTSLLNDWSYTAFKVWVRLKPGTDAEAFCKKLYQHSISEGEGTGREVKNLELMPITHCRYELYAKDLPIEFHYLVLFSFTGGLVIVCALFNYLSLFASRLRMRIRELALRKVCGSSYQKLYVLLCTEFVLVLCLSCLLGLTIIELSLSAFQEFSGVKGEVYAESLLYFAGLVLLAMLAFGLVLSHFYRRIFRQALKGATDKRSQQLFHRSSLVLQMSIGLLLMFCIGMILKQTYYLRSVDIGMERKNIATLQVRSIKQVKAVAEHIRRIPLASEVLTDYNPLIPQTTRMSMPFNDWEGKQPTDEPLNIEAVFGGRYIFDFYKFRLLQGEAMPIDGDNQAKVMINETAARAFGWKDPVGKTIAMNVDGKLTVVGLIKDFHQSSPTTPVKPIILMSGDTSGFGFPSPSILMKYGTGQWKSLQTAIDSVMVQNFPEVKYELIDAERTYEGYLKSENTLLKLLSFVAVICVLISAFGIYSFVTLTCERRRKEIAIRKVNGARVSDILYIFLKEYTVLLVVSSAIAFSVGYALMKRWLESYVEQTAISWWVYGAVFAGIACVVLLSIWTRVWKAANQNPAEVIKSE